MFGSFERFNIVEPAVNHVVSSTGDHFQLVRGFIVEFVEYFLTFANSFIERSGEAVDSAAFGLNDMTVKSSGAHRFQNNRS